MPKILDNGKFRVYVYASDDNPHYLPHCHVYWNGNDHASVVSRPDLAVVAGEALPRAAIPPGECCYPHGGLTTAEPVSGEMMTRKWDRAAMRFASASVRHVLGRWREECLRP